MSQFVIGVESPDGKSFFHDIEASDMHHALTLGESIADEATREHARKFFLTSIVAIGLSVDEKGSGSFSYIDQEDSVSIDQYDSLVTWRAAKGCMAIDVPRKLVTVINRSSGAKHNVALSKLEKFLASQFNAMPQQIIKDALGDKYRGTRIDYLTLTRMACRELDY